MRLPLRLWPKKLKLKKYNSFKGTINCASDFDIKEQFKKEPELLNDESDIIMFSNGLNL